MMRQAGTSSNNRQTKRSCQSDNGALAGPIPRAVRPRSESGAAPSHAPMSDDLMETEQENKLEAVEVPASQAVEVPAAVLPPELERHVRVVPVRALQAGGPDLLTDAVTRLSLMQHVITAVGHPQLPGTQQGPAVVSAGKGADEHRVIGVLPCERLKDDTSSLVDKFLHAVVTHVQGLLPAYTAQVECVKIYSAGQGMALHDHGGNSIINKLLRTVAVGHRLTACLTLTAGTSSMLHLKSDQLHQVQLPAAALWVADDVGDGRALLQQPGKELLVVKHGRPAEDQPRITVMLQLHSNDPKAPHAADWATSLPAFESPVQCTPQPHTIPPLPRLVDCPKPKPLLSVLSWSRQLLNTKGGGAISEVVKKHADGNGACVASTRTLEYLQLCEAVSDVQLLRELRAQLVASMAADNVAHTQAATRNNQLPQPVGALAELKKLGNVGGLNATLLFLRDPDARSKALTLLLKKPNKKVQFRFLAKADELVHEQAKAELAEELADELADELAGESEQATEESEQATEESEQATDESEQATEEASLTYEAAATVLEAFFGIDAFIAATTIVPAGTTIIDNVEDLAKLLLQAAPLARVEGGSCSVKLKAAILQGARLVNSSRAGLQSSKSEKGQAQVSHRAAAKPHAERTSQEEKAINDRERAGSAGVGKGKGVKEGAAPHSTYAGVTWHSSNQMWMAQIRVKGVPSPVNLGYFRDEAEAARAFDDRKAAEFNAATCKKAKLNFPDEWQMLDGKHVRKA